MTVPYVKPHATYAQQVEILRSRGLECSDEAAAISLLKTVGYYRLSAYVYPFRELLPVEQQRQQSPTHYRSEQIVAGKTFEMVVDIWRFDRELRLLVLDAIETIEIGLRSRISDQLGERDVFGHHHKYSLDAKQCDKPAWHDRRNQNTRHEEWLARYRAAVRAAKEDFIRHNVHKYEQLPVWIGLEILTFGNVVALFNLMKQEDQTAIARDLGIKGGSLLAGWFETVNYVRNVAAHHARLWNRTTTLKVRRPRQHQVGPHLQHLVVDPPTDKIYSSLAVMAHLVRQFDPNSEWQHRVREHIRAFPVDTGMSPTGSMGFPAHWEVLDLWSPSDV